MFDCASCKQLARSATYLGTQTLEALVSVSRWEAVASQALPFLEVPDTVGAVRMKGRQPTRAPRVRGQQYIPFLCAVAHKNGEDPVESGVAGFERYLLKPIAALDLSALLQMPLL